PSPTPSPSPSPGPAYGFRRTNMQLTIEAIRRINKLQEAQFLSLHYEKMPETRTIAEDGLGFLERLISPSSSPSISSTFQIQNLRNSPEEIAQFRTEFGVGVTLPYPGLTDFGDALM